MSYEKNIDGRVVKFQREDDYLRCKLQFLQRQRLDIFAPTTLFEFIQIQGYDENCVIESITDVQSWVSTYHGSSSVGIDNATYYASHMLGNFITDQTNANNVYADSSNSTGVIGNAFMDTSSMEISSGFYFDSQTGEINFMENSFVVPPAQPEPIPPKEEKREEPPEEPIGDRWEILDL